MKSKKKLRRKMENKEMSNNPELLISEAAKVVLSALESRYEAWLQKQRVSTEDEEFINRVMEDNHKVAIEYIKGMLLG